MNLPNDPMILLSVVNTQLRDFYPSLEEFCKSNFIDRKELEKKLSSVDYRYDEKQNRFL